MIKVNLTLVFLAFCMVPFSNVEGQSENQYPIFRARTKKESQPGYIKQSGNYKSPSLSLVAVGDLMMAGSALSVIKHEGVDYPFDSTRTIIQSADLAMSNLEAPFTKLGEPANKKFTFCVPPSYATGIKRAGFDILTLANNHILDYGPIGLASTIEVLDSLHLAHCGAGANVSEANLFVILNVNGWRVGFLAYSLTYPSIFWAGSSKPGTAYPHLIRVKRNIYTLRDSVDIIVVSFHWGGELLLEPKAYQKYYAHQVIDYGADLVIGHHPHVLQGLEVYKGKPILYSLGNYVFGSYSSKARSSIIFKIYFDVKGPLFAECIPINVNNYNIRFQPRVLKGRPREDVIRLLQMLSGKLDKQGQSIIGHSGLVYLNRIAHE